MADEDGFAWKGSPRPRNSGGFVDGVGVNTPLSPLAIDPGTSSAPRRNRNARRVAEGVDGSGPNLELERMEPNAGEGGNASGPGSTRRNGRVRLPR